MLGFLVLRRQMFGFLVLRLGIALVPVRRAARLGRLVRLGIGLVVRRPRGPWGHWRRRRSMRFLLVLHRPLLSAPAGRDVRRLLLVHDVRRLLGFPGVP